MGIDENNIQMARQFGKRDFLDEFFRPAALNPATDPWFARLRAVAAKAGKLRQVEEIIKEAQNE